MTLSPDRGSSRRLPLPTGAAYTPPWLFVAAVVLPLLVFTIDLGTPSLWDPDEGRHAEIAREMLLTRDWLAPQLDFSPYRDKTPVFYWMLAGALDAFGVKNEAAARLPGACLAIVGVWAALYWGWKHLQPLSGALAAVILSTTAGYVAIGRLVIIDAVYGALLTLALLEMGRPLLGVGGFPWRFWVLLAAATVVRGPVAPLVALLVAATYAAALRQPRRLLLLRPLGGLALFAALAMPLFVRLALRDPEYVADFLWRANLLRFFAWSPTIDDLLSIVFYLWMVPVLMLPWSLFLPWSLRDVRRPGNDASSGAALYLAAWITAVMLFLTAAGTKLPTYVFPLFPPLALLTARWLAWRLRRPAAADVLGDPLLLGGAAIFAVALLSPLVGYEILASQFPMYTDKVVYTLLLVPFALFGVGALLLQSRPGVLGAVAMCGIATLAGLYHFGSATVSAYNSMELPANLIAAELPPTAPLLAYRTTTHSLSFYSGRPVRELDDLSSAESLLNGGAAVALLTKERYLPELRTRLRRILYIWWEGDSKKVLLTNRPPPAGGDPRILLPQAAKRTPAP